MEAQADVIDRPFSLQALSGEAKVKEPQPRAQIDNLPVSILPVDIVSKAITELNGTSPLEAS